MSRGPGRIERAIATAFTAQPHHAFPVEELVAVAFPDIEGIEKKHRVAVLRAAHNVAQRMRWCTMRASDYSASLTFYNPVDLRSTAEANVWRINTRNDLRDALADLDNPNGRYRQHIQPGGSWWKDVELERCRRR